MFHEVFSLKLDTAGPMAAPTYYTFASFLGEEVAATYLTLPRRPQIAHFEAYLAYLQAEQVQFPTSKRATKCHAVPRATSTSQSTALPLLPSLLEGSTISGFGVCGSPEGFLPQLSLSMRAAHLATDINHTYVVENDSVLNSRSFMFGWCHAEKQKLVDIHHKLLDAAASSEYWEHLRLVVDRAMCPDCVAFVSAYAAHHKVDVFVQDPDGERRFTASGAVEQKTA
ncbi:hypothetical protein ACHHYP_05269 [Achlya hypogyna]|uniref:Single-strand DNA deaminase toxin A-like C-terminal domain-containing protein n=1 Tax=Achlya hypogyna TaxID=1202772 RepID=A0A1V9YYN3_ACHHY|nr:hypothetical protein ACHHYP_05269 [Achlya hypogyna]